MKPSLSLLPLSSLLGILLSGCIIAAGPISRTGQPSEYPAGYEDLDDDPFSDRNEFPDPVRPRPAYWGLVAPGVPYNDVSFTDFNTGWVVGDVDPYTRKAVIRHTRNAGATWAVEDRGSNELHAVHFVNPNVGYVAGDNGVIFRTDDAGSTWKLQDSGTAEPIVDIAFLNLTDGLFLTRNDGVYQTTDGGATWERRNVVSDARQIAYMPNGTAYITAGSGLFRFESGVLARLDFPPDRPHHVAFGDPALRYGWAVGSYGSLYQTRDGGSTWEEIRRFVTPDQYVSGFSASAVAFTSRREGMLLTDRSAYFTANGGESWQRADSRLSFGACGKYFRLFDETHGWAFGDGQSLYRLGM